MKSDLNCLTVIDSDRLYICGTLPFHLLFIVYHCANILRCKLFVGYKQGMPDQFLFQIIFWIKRTFTVESEIWTKESRNKLD